MPNKMAFHDIRWADVRELGVCQLYLSIQKLNNILTWFRPKDLSSFAPLPVHHFGNGRFTLTDGHSRAYTAYQAGITKIPIVYDFDEIVTSPTGQMLYRNDIVWCERFDVRSICDLENRIVSREAYQKLWIDRCSAAYHLLTQTTAEQRAALEREHPNLFLFGASEDLRTLYWEDLDGNVHEFIRSTSFCHPAAMT